MKTYQEPVPAANSLRWYFWLFVPKNAGIIGVIASLLSIVVYYTETRDRHASRPWTEKFTPDLRREVRAARHDAQISTFDRQKRLDRVVVEFADSHRLNADQVLTQASNLMKQMDLADEAVFRGGHLFAQRHFAAARPEFESGTQLDPESSRAWSGLGATCVLLGDTDAARFSYNQALRLDPDDWQIQYNFGLFLARIAEPGDALPHLRQALNFLRQDPEQKSVLRSLQDELQDDAGLKNLREQPGFAELVRAN